MGATYHNRQLVLVMVLSLSHACANHAGYLPPELDEDDPLAMFTRADGDGDGKLDNEEYGRFYSTFSNSETTEPAIAAGSDGGTPEWSDFFQRADTFSDGKLTFDEWSGAMLTAMQQNDVPLCPAAIAAAHGGGATLATGGVADAVHNVAAADGSRSTGEGNEASDFAKAFDTNKDGFLDITEFRELMAGDGMDGQDEDAEVDEVLEVFTKWDVMDDKLLSMDELLHGLNLAAGVVPDIPAEFYQAREIDEYGSAVDQTLKEHLKKDMGARMIAGADVGELFALVRVGNVGGVESWLQLYDMPDGGVRDGMCSPLHVALQQFDKAVQHQHFGASAGKLTAVALLLIDKGADLRHECNNANPLLWAVMVRCLPAVRAILDVYTRKVESKQIPKYDMMLHYRGERDDLSPGGGDALHAAAYLHPTAIGVSKILTAHPGAGSANRQMHERGVTWRHGHVLPPHEKSGLWDSFEELLLAPHLHSCIEDGHARFVYRLHPFISLYIHTCTHADTCKHARACKHIHTRTKKHTHTHTHTHAHARTRTHTHAHARTHAHIHKHTRTHKHTRARARARTHTHTYTHIPTHAPSPSSPLLTTHTHTHTQ